MAKQIEQEQIYQTLMAVPLTDLRSEHQRLRRGLREIWDGVLDNASFVGGRHVEQFESSFAQFCEVKHAIGVANGTDALMLALKALGIGANDEVITAANTFVATAEAIVHAGARPVFADIDPQSYNIDVNEIERHITSRTKAIISVHLYGQPADMDAVLALARRYGLKVIEDAAQAHGARYHGQRIGSIGHAACFSFYPAKNLGACGDGGAIVTNDPDVSTAARRLRDHGGLKKYEHHRIGHNSRLDSLQAAVLQMKLSHLDGRNALRRRHADTYDRLLAHAKHIARPYVPSGIDAVYHLYVIRVQDGRRGALQEYLMEHGVETGIHYPVPVHRTRAFAAFNTDHCPVAEQYAEQILSLPMYPEMETHQVEYVANLVCDYMNDLGGRN